MISRQVDSRGRMMLGRSFAGSTMLLEKRKDGTIVLHPAITIPRNEAWLWKNKRALAMVQQGLKKARKRQFVPGPRDL